MRIELNKALVVASVASERRGGIAPCRKNRRRAFSLQSGTPEVATRHIAFGKWGVRFRKAWLN